MASAVARVADSGGDRHEGSPGVYRHFHQDSYSAIPELPGEHLLEDVGKVALERLGRRLFPG